mgnify:CR=1 FL=1
MKNLEIILLFCFWLLTYPLTITIVLHCDIKNKKTAEKYIKSLEDKLSNKEEGNNEIDTKR